MVERVETEDEVVALLRLAAAGSSEAFERFRALHLEDLESYADRLELEDPELTVATAIWALVERADSFRGSRGEQVRSYLYRSVRNQSIDERRRQARRGRVETLDDDIWSRDALGTPLADERAMEPVEDQILVNSLLENVTPAQREVMELRYLEDLTLAETASRTGRTVQATAQLQQRALRALRAAVITAALIALVAAGVLGRADRSETKTDFHNRPTDPAPTETDGADTEGASAVEAETVTFSPEFHGVQVFGTGEGYRIAGRPGYNAVVLPDATVQVTSSATLSDGRSTLPEPTVVPGATDTATCATGAEVAEGQYWAIHYGCHLDGSPLDPETVWMFWNSFLEANEANPPSSDLD